MKTYPISKLQKILWFEWKMRPFSNAYNNIYIYRLNSDIDTQRLNKALSTVHVLFPILSTRFEESPDGIKQHIISLNDIKAIILDSKDKLLELLLSPFNLSQDYLFRYAIFVQDKEIYLGFCWHHIITDAHSVSIILNVISKILSNVSISFECQQFKQQDQLEIMTKQAKKLADCLPVVADYWKFKLHNITPSLVKSKYEIIENEGGKNGKRLVFTLLGSLTNEVMSRVGNFKTTLFIYVAACIGRTFLYQTNDENLLVGFTVNSRERDYLNQIGNFAVQLLLVMKKFKDIPSLIESISKQLVVCRQNSQYLLSDIYKLYRCQAQRSVTKLFNVSINYGTDSSSQLLGATPETYEGFESTNDLIIRFEYINKSAMIDNIEKPSTIIFEIDYNSTKFPTTEVQKYIKELISEMISVENDV